MKIKYLEIEVQVHNEREQSLFRIVNYELERIAEDWMSVTEWKESFEKAEHTHWRIRELDGEISAMYFLDMIKEPTSDVTIYRTLRSLVEREENVA